MRLLLSVSMICLGGWISTQLAAQDEGSATDTCEMPRLAQELADRVAKDQAARKELMASMKKESAEGENAAGPDSQLLTTLTKIDAENTAWLKEQVEAHGWLGKTLVGEQGAQDAWLLVQHADRDRRFQKHCLELMNAMPAGEVSQTNIAYLTDRVLRAEGKPQRYGTQIQMVNGKASVGEVEEPENLDTRRQKVGLPPIEEYLKLIESKYGTGK